MIRIRKIFLKPETGLVPVVLQAWEKSERGWGTEPDGCSLHTSKDIRNRFIEDYRKNLPDKVPEVYSRPIGEPITAYVDKETYEEINKSENGVRAHDKIIRG